MATRDGGIKSTSINGVKMYTLASQQPSTASWIPSKKQASHRKIKSYTQNMQLLQDLRFETATTKIKATPDGEYLIASGIYPPQVKVYEVRELGLKFERHLDSEIIDFQVNEAGLNFMKLITGGTAVFHSSTSTSHCNPSYLPNIFAAFFPLNINAMAILFSFLPV